MYFDQLSSAELIQKLVEKVIIKLYRHFHADSPVLTEELDGGVRVRVSLPRDLTSSSLFFIFGVMSLIQLTECLG